VRFLRLHRGKAGSEKLKAANSQGGWRHPREMGAEEEFRLPLQLLSGSGLRAYELLRRRIKDLDFTRAALSKCARRKSKLLSV